MSETRGTPRDDRTPDVDGFRDLIDRPTPELDSSSLWCGIEARLTERSRPAQRATGWAAAMTPGRMAWGAVAMVLVILASWAALVTRTPGTAPQIVLLMPPQPEAPSFDATTAAAEPGSGAQLSGGVRAQEVGPVTSEDAPLQLDVRLVRGYNGVPPADVSASPTAGAGGADALRDARASIEGLLPFESYGLVGSARITLDDSAPLVIILSGDYRLLTRSVQTRASPQRTVLIEGLELVGVGQESMPSDLSLEPGRLYILGVLPDGVEDPELVLLIRARAQRDGGG